ncbi:MAG: hypothetical protein EOP11_10185 [Proteobacteria bacterium]|nr:MAG: hypothetical protein EOP11_10185 [Pseudomonadota bacterium]
MKLGRFGIAIVGAIALSSCASLGIGGGPKQVMNVDPSVPAAHGEVQAKESDNGNTEVRLKVEHLARPEALGSEAKTYVVWVQDSATGEHVQNLGALKVNDSLKGSIRALTPLKRFDIFVTPEPLATAESPSGERVLWSTVSL